ncbi:MAG: O-methyltransferase [Myxococcota bacterium]
MADTDSRSGARYAGANILEWTGRVHAPHDDTLERAYRAAEEHGLPPIQIGPSEGKAIALLLQLAGARKAVEIGTLAGYSALWMAKAMGPEGRVWTIEADPQAASVARHNIAAGGFDDRIQVMEGTAVEVLPELEGHGPFDAVFIDADKQAYDRYGAWAATNLRAGGLLIGDNAYLFGRLLDSGEDGEAMRRFHEQASRDFESVCLPTPDGLLVGIRRRA